MKGRSIAPANTSVDTSDLQSLRQESLNLLVGVILVIALGFLGLAAVDQAVNQLPLWLIFLPLVGAAGVGRIHRLGLPVASVLLLALLCLSVVAAMLVYPGSQLIYAFPLLIMITSILLDGWATLTAAALLSALSLASIWLNDVGVVSPGLALFLIWTTATFSWLASRPSLIALKWAWRNYSLAIQRTEELRSHQSELGRLAKSLGETCARLEAMNWELERARRAAEEARQLKAEFAATISHELRTPLNLIIGFSEMMIRNPRAYGGQVLPESYRQDLDAIHRNASHMSQLVDDVLDLSQIEAHRMALEKTHAALGKIVDDACSMVRTLYERSGLTLTVDLPPDLPILTVDANRIRQILVNLLNNAVRFTDHGGVTLRASRDDQGVIVSVTDTGDGIAPEDIPYVFREFQQVGASDHRRGGSGFGLAVCQRFAEMHGGYMWVESQLGLGSTFYLALPLKGNVVSETFSSLSTPRKVDPSVKTLEGAILMWSNLLPRNLPGGIRFTR